MAVTSVDVFRKPRSRATLLHALFGTPLAALSLTLLVPVIFTLL